MSGPSSAKALIGKRTVDALKAVTGETRLWDTDLKGFCVRAYPSGRRVYAVKYRVDGRQRWLTIGDHDPWTPTAARDEASTILHQASKGIDPALAKQKRRAAGTVADLVERYLDEGPGTRPDKRASSWAADRANLTHHVIPLLGGRPSDGLTKADVGRMVRDIASGKTAAPVKPGKLRGRVKPRGGAGIAERTRASLSAMYGWAVEHGLTTANPATGVRVERRASRERFLSVPEVIAMFEALRVQQAAGAIPQNHADIVRLLILTGARKTEIAALRWSEFDAARRQLVLPPERTKAGGKNGDRRIHLPTAAVLILGAVKRKPGSPWVFPGARGEGPTTGLQKSWSKVRTAAKLEGVRIHDLRHSFASLAAADGASLIVIQKALGHADSRTTQRYAHLADAAVADMVERTADSLAGVQ
jgi:integrase